MLELHKRRTYYRRVNMEKDVINTILLAGALVVLIVIAIVLAINLGGEDEDDEIVTHTPDEYVETTGDIMTGDLVVENLYANGVINGDGSRLSNLNASMINTGTIGSARLPPNINADTLDGYDSIEFAMVIHTHDDRYYTETESDARFALISHTHLPGDADTLDSLDSTDFAMAAHTHDTRYYQRSEVDANFLNLGGGTLTGDMYLPNLYASGIISGDGSALTNLNASRIMTGTIGLARLPPNIDADTLDGLNSVDFALVAHTHDASDIISGALGEARLPQNAIDDSEIEPGLGLVPSGTIVMWNGTTIPTGWALCDGTNGTPDLRGMFIVGYDSGDPDYDIIGVTGGEKAHTLTTSEMPSHSHSVTGSTNTDGNHFHDYEDRYSVGLEDVMGVGAQARDDLDNFQSKSTNTAGSHSHSVTGTALDTGGGQAHENRPPYFVLAFIMKL